MGRAKVSKKLLYISHRIPYPPNKGDKIRTFNEIKYLSQFFEIDLISFADDPSDLKFKSNLKDYCRQVHVFFIHPVYSKLKGIRSFLTGRSISETYFLNEKAINTTASLLKKVNYNVIFCFSSPTAEYVFRNISLIRRASVRLIMDFCDVDSDKWQQYASKASFPLKQVYTREADRLLMYEKKINREFDVSIFVSENEADLFKKKVPEAKNLIPVKNGVDFEYFSKQNQQQKKNKHPAILFTGAMDYYANIQGVTWFAKKILPIIKQEIPGIDFIIAGSNPSKKVKELSNIDGISVTGYVDDIRTCYHKADISVVPLKIARGIQNKILEAMAMKLPVVCTSEALSGIDAKPGVDLILADEAREFAEAVIYLLKNQTLAEKIAISANRKIKEHYSWNACLSRLQICLSNGN